VRFNLLRTLLLGACLTAGAAAHAKSNGGSKKMDPTMMTKAYTATYSAGPQWKPNLPPDKQDLGGHFGYVQKLFDEGTLLANGLLADGRGFYVFAVADAAVMDAILAGDPGIDSGVLKLDAAASWLLAFDNLSAGPKDAKLFVVNYRPGPSWRPRKPLSEQDLGSHMSYVTGALGQGTLLGGGPVDAHHGRYVISAADDRAAAAWVDADPAVASGVFRGEIVRWQTFNRQKARRSQASAASTTR